MKETKEAIKVGKIELMKYLRYLWKEREKSMRRKGLIGQNIEPYFEFKAIEKAFDIGEKAISEHMAKVKTNDWINQRSLNIGRTEGQADERKRVLRMLSGLKKEASNRQTGTKEVVNIIVEGLRKEIKK